MCYYNYVDDRQIYVSLTAACSFILSLYRIEQISMWKQSNFLQLNAAKIIVHRNKQNV